MAIGAGEDAEVEADAARELGEDRPLGARRRPGWPIAARRRWRRPSGCVTRAVLLGVGLGREDDGRRARGRPR